MRQFKYISFLLFVFASWLSNAQVAPELTERIDSLLNEPEWDEDTLANEDIIDDTISYDLTTLPQDVVDEYKNDPRYFYKRKGAKKRPKRNNWLNKAFDRFFRWLDETFDIRLPRGLLVTIKYVLLYGFILLVIYFIVRALGFNFRFRKKREQLADNPEFEELEKNLEEVDFDHLIAQAIKNKSYRVAVRLLFLKNLQTLSKNEIIEWEIDKTNNEYKYELPNRLRQPFEEMVYLFEHIWYGHFDVEEERFRTVIRDFRDFEKRLK